MEENEKKLHEGYYKTDNTGQILRYEWYAQKYFENVRGKKILEIGCGDGGVINLLRERNDVFAVDLSKKGVEFLKKMGIKASLKDISKEKLPFEDSKFDYVIILETLEHLKSPQFAIEEIQRVLKRNGIMIVSTPNPRTAHKLIYPSLFKQKNFKEYLENNRFEVLSTSNYGICPPFWINLKNYLEKKHSNQRMEKGKKGDRSPTSMSKLARLFSNRLFNTLKPNALAWSFVFICKNINPHGAKDLYAELADETKMAYQ